MDPVARQPILFLPTTFEPEVFDLTHVKPKVEELANQISIAFHSLHQKRAQSNITDEHKAWATCVQVALDAADTAWKKAPKKTQINSCALVDALYYKTYYDMLVVDATSVMDALTNAQQCEDLKHLKEIVAACDKMTTDTTKALTPKSDEAKEFVEITHLNFTVQHEQKDPTPFTLEDTVPLPAQYKFRTGNQEWTKTSYIGGYPQIAGTINYLESIAHRLHKIERDLRAEMKSACKGNLEANSQLLNKCDSLEQALTLHLNVLKSKSHSNQIHAGWYYLKGLTAQLAATKAAIAAFDKMKGDAFGTSAQITGKIIRCLDQGDLFCLYEAAVIVEKNPNAMSTLKEVISREAATRLLHTPEEAKLAVKAFGSEVISNEELTHYLTKGFIQSIFSHNTTAEFKLVVAKLSTTRKFTEIVKHSTQLSQLHKHYFTIVKAHPHEKLLNILSLLYTARPDTTMNEVVELDHFMRFSQAKMELAECRQIDPNNNPRIEYVQGCLDKMCTEWKIERICKTTKSELFEVLKTRLFDLDPEARKTADQKLEEVTSSLKADQLEPIVKALYFRWLLGRFIELESERPTNIVEQGINWLADAVQQMAISDEQARRESGYLQNLRYFFNEYSQTALWKSLFDLHYTEDYMQNALLAFEKDYN